MPGKQKHVALFPVPWVQSATGNAWMPVVLAAILTLSPLMALGEDWLYKMRPGDSLWSITTQHLKHIRYWKSLQELNGVDDPWHMLPGTEIRIPLSWVKLRPTTLVVMEVRGEVNMQSGGHGDRVPVARGTALSSGDFLYTGADGSVTLSVADGSRLLVGPGSDVQLERLRVYGSSNHVDTQIRLMRGRTESLVTPRTGGDVPRYEIKTPAAVSAVRGTRYRTSADANGEISATEVLEGVVGVTGSGVSRSVPGGFGTITLVDSPPSDPIPLLDAPNLSTLPGRIERVPFPIAFPAVAGSTAHRIQVATEPDFRTLVFEQVTGVGTARIPDLPDGEYILRIRAVDADGLEGHESDLRITIDARPEAPFLVSPTPGALISEEKPEFLWARPAESAGYRLQVARDSGFDALVTDLTDVDAENAIAPQPLPPGQYYWRVATRADDGEVGPWGDGSMFKRMPPAPDLEQPEITEQGISFQWARGLPGDRYEFQLARDPDFQDIVHRTVVPEPDVRLDRPESGYFFIRVRTIDSAGDVGPFGAPQRVNVPPSSYWPAILTTLFVLILAL